MEDILTVGKDRGPAWRRRGLIAVAVAVVVSLVAIKYWPGDHQHRATPSMLPKALSKEPLPRIVPGLAGVPGKKSSPRLRLMRGVRVPVAGPRPLWFWPATGRTEPIRGLPVTGAGYTFMRVPGGWALTRSTFARPACTPCMSAALPVYFLPDDGSAARWATTADIVAPALGAGRLWLTSYQADADPGTSVGYAREVSAHGTSLGSVVRLPAGFAIVGATDRGLLLVSVAPRGGLTAFFLWKPGAGRASFGQSFGTVLAVDAQQVAWVPTCTSRCAVKVTDVVTGHVMTLRQQAGEVAVSAAFSPDGKYLAVRVSAGFPGIGKSASSWLYVVSLRTGLVTVVPGTRTSGGTLVAFGWPDNTDTLVAELALPSEIQLTAWRPGTARPDVVTLEPRGATLLVLG